MRSKYRLPKNLFCTLVSYSLLYTLLQLICVNEVSGSRSRGRGQYLIQVGDYCRRGLISVSKPEGCKCMRDHRRRWSRNNSSNSGCSNSFRQPSRSGRPRITPSTTTQRPILITEIINYSQITSL